MPPKSCQPCRKRRIACVDLGSGSCLTCQRRGVKCSGPPSPEDFIKHTRVRKGQRLEELREQLGLSNDEQEAAAMENAPSTPLDVATVISPASKLFNFELAAALHHHLLTGKLGECAT